MVAAISSWLYRYTSVFTAVPSVLLFLLYVLVIMPGAADVPRIVGTAVGVPEYFRLFVYSPDDFYNQLESMGSAGRSAFIKYRLTHDNIFIVSVGAFFSILTGMLLRRTTAQSSRLRLLNTVGLLPAIGDLGENYAQILLILLFPDRYDPALIAVSFLTATKWISLVAAMLILLTTAVIAILIPVVRFARSR